MGAKFNGTMKMIDDLNRTPGILTNPDAVTHSILIDIALSLAVIADTIVSKEDQQKYADYKQNEEVPVRPVPGSDMVASESMENANEASSSNIQKDDGSEETKENK